MTVYDLISTDEMIGLGDSSYAKAKTYTHRVPTKYLGDDQAVLTNSVLIGILIPEITGFDTLLPPDQTINMHNISSPRNDDESVEQKIQAKCLKAPRVTPADLIANISSEYYFTAGQGASANGFSCHELSLDLLTICVLVLKNGYTIMGKSAVASSANFDAALGRSIARESAINELWPLMGYELRSKLHAQEAEDEIQ